MSVSFIEGKFSSKALRLNGKSLNIPANIQGDYTILLYRKLESEDTWTRYVILSSGVKYINNVQDNQADTSWIYINSNGNLIIESTAEDIDELLVLPRLVNDTELNGWTTVDRPFYDALDDNNPTPPNSVTMEVL